jgi:hypothetical protein
MIPMISASLPEENPPLEDVAPEPPLPPPAPSFYQLLRDNYLTFDRRTLGFARLMLGFFLLTDLFHRGRSWSELYSSAGVLPTELGLSRPQSGGAFTIFLGFSTPGELRVLWAFMLVTFVCLFLGYKTRVMQLLALVLVTGMNGRLLLAENGGYTVQNLLVLWTSFLPLGDRFSLDALIASMKRRREASAAELNDRSDVLLPEQEQPHVTAMGPILLLQLAAIYFFNFLHKTGREWKDGTAVHYVLYNDRMATPIVAAMRDHLPNPIVKLMTGAALRMEEGLPVALLSPLGRVWSRRAAIVMINALHIAFGVTFVLGPFAWACCVFSTLLFSREDWEIAHETMRRARRARTVIFDRRSAGALLLCRLLKRLDHLELLTFRRGKPGPLGVAVEGEDRVRLTRSAAFADIVSALPLGPILALPLRAPVLRSAFDALFAAIERRDASGDLGLALRPSFTAEGPSPLRRGGRRALRVLGEIMALLMFVVAVNQAMIQLWVINRRIKVSMPEPLVPLTIKMRFQQGWYMFSPGPVMDDGTIVVDAVTVDGRHVDPFSIHVEPYTLRAPDFDLIHAKSLRTNQLWGDYFNRIHLPGYTGYRGAMKDYMLALPQRTGHPEDTLVSGDVFWVTDQNPRWGETESFDLQKTKLFSFEATDPAVAGPAGLPGLPR